MKSYISILNILSIVCGVLTISGCIMSFVFVQSFLGDIHDDITFINNNFKDKSEEIWRSLREINVNPGTLRNRRQAIQHMIGYPLSTSTAIGYSHFPATVDSRKKDIRRRPSKKVKTTSEQNLKVGSQRINEIFYDTSTVQSQTYAYSVPDPIVPQYASIYDNDGSSSYVSSYDTSTTPTTPSFIPYSSFESAAADENTSDVEFKEEKWKPICKCPTENKCPAGPPGPKGIDGIPGEHGEDGAPGQKALDMDDTMIMIPLISHCITCPQGEVGPPGAEGKRGQRGLRGARGADGGAGRDGTPGFPGLHGPEGTPGEDGEAGPVGVSGMHGIAGSGLPGAKGTPGLEGEPGPIGSNGSDGVNGLMGPPGPRGSQGTPGAHGALGEVGEGGIEGEAGEDAEYCPCPRVRHDYSMIANRLLKL